MQREGEPRQTLEKTKWLLDFAFELIGERPVANVTPPEPLAVLRKIEKRGRYETARRLRSTCGMVAARSMALTARRPRELRFVWRPLFSSGRVNCVVLSGRSSILMEQNG